MQRINDKLPHIKARRYRVYYTHTQHTHTHTNYLVLVYRLLKKMGLNFLKLVLILEKIFQRLVINII